MALLNDNINEIAGYSGNGVKSYISNKLVNKNWVLIFKDDVRKSEVASNLQENGFIFIGSNEKGYGNVYRYRYGYIL